MDKCTVDLCDEMSVLSVVDENEHLEKLCLDNSVRKQLMQIKNDYESVFSWNIKQLTGVNNQNLMLNLVDKIHDKLDMIINKENEFDINRFYLQLIICYEEYINGNYKDSILEIENIVKSLESCIFNNSFGEYSDAFNHIAWATNAYIALTLKLDSEKIMKKLKSVKQLNRAEKSAISAIKARIFMEYPPKGNDIALRFANEACNLHSTESEWITIWLKAKGRVRRYYAQYKFPEEDEIDSAEMLCTTKTKPKLLIAAASVYVEMAFIYKMNRNLEKSNEYYKLSSDLTSKTVELAKDDIKILYSCLMTYINYPKEFCSNTMIDKIIQKLTNIKNNRIDQVLGKYYLKHGNDYEKAKIYLSRAMASGHFNSSLQLIKVECLIQPINKFPLVQTLNMIYDIFVSPKRRLIILSQILLYYNYCENNSKELMHYLKLYMDQDIDNTFKERHLIYAHPLYKIKEFKPKQFLYVLSNKIKNIMKNEEWSTEEKIAFNDLITRFSKMSGFNIVENDFLSNNKDKYRKQNSNSNSNRYPKNNRSSFHKQSHNNSKNTRNNTSFNKKNNKFNCEKEKVISKIDIEYKHGNTSGPSIIQNIGGNNKKDKIPRRRLSNENLSQQHKLDISRNIDSKFKKFDAEYSSLENLHKVTKEDDITFKKLNRAQKDKNNTNLRYKNNPDGPNNPNSSRNNYNYRNRQRNSYLPSRKNGQSKNELRMNNQNPPGGSNYYETYY